MATEQSETSPSSQSCDYSDQQLKDLSRAELEQWYLNVQHMLAFVLMQHGCKACVGKDQLEDIPRELKLYYWYDMATQSTWVEVKEYNSDN